MNRFAEQQIQDTLSIIDSSIINCEKVQPKLKEGSPQLSLSRNRIKALYISKALLLNQENSYTKGEMEKAAIQIASIRKKCITGKQNAKENSPTSIRFSRIIDAMDMILAFLKIEI